MRRIMIMIGAALILSTAAFSTADAQQTAIFGFAQSWVDAQADFKAYDEVYFRNVDLRGMSVKVYDSDGDLVQDRISQDTMQQLGLTIFRGFVEQLQGVVTVNMEDLEVKDLKARKFLVVDLKISGTYETQEDRLLMKMIKGSAKPPLSLSLEGKVLDSVTEKEVITFSDQKDIAEISDTPFEASEDIEKFSDLVGQWASYLKDFFAKKRK